jgi:hypothetical protein
MFHDILVDREGCSGLSVSMRHGVHRILLIAADSDDLTVLAWHLDEVVGVVGDRHELGEGGET